MTSRDLDQATPFQGLGLETVGRCIAASPQRPRSTRDQDHVSRGTAKEKSGRERRGDGSEEAGRQTEIEKMTPTRGNEEIEGRSYKDYAYSPVPVSSPLAVNDTPPVRESVELDVRDRTS